MVGFFFLSSYVVGSSLLIISVDFVSVSRHFF